MKGLSGSPSLYTVAATASGANPTAISLGANTMEPNPMTGGPTWMKQLAVWLDEDTIVFSGKPTTDTTNTGYGFYKLTVSTGSIVPIKTAIGACADFEISPDGSKILFQGLATVSLYGTHITVTHILTLVIADGTTVDINSDETTAAVFWQPHWLGSSKVSYVRQTNAPATDIYVANADGTGKTAITTGKSIVAMSASPDGTKIAYRNKTSSFASELRCVGADGAGDLSLESDPPLGFDWSKNSSYIVYYAIKGTESNIFFIKSDGTGATKVWASGKYMNNLAPYRPWAQ
jgi:Tol biopolymer transport system component